MLRLIHAADFHLDSPFAGHTPAQAALCRAGQREAVLRLGEQIQRLGCELVLLAGDLFDGPEVYGQSLDALRQALDQGKTRVFIAPGNHDPYTLDSPWAKQAWPENVHIFRTPEITAVELPELGCRVYGAAFTGPIQGPVLRGFRAAEDDLVNLMVLHADPGEGESPYCPVSKADIGGSGLDYLALGHIHKRFARKIGQTFVGMPGCTMGRGFDETGEKGAYYVTAQKGDCQIRFVPLGAPRYEALDIPAGEDALSAVLSSLPEDTRRDHYRLRLTGSVSAPPDLDELDAALRGRFASLELRDQTVPVLPLWRDLEENSLRGEFLRLLRQDYDAADPERRSLLELAGQLTLELMDGREVSL